MILDYENFIRFRRSRSVFYRRWFIAGDVFLPKALIKLGLDARIFTPKYGSVDGTAPNFPGAPKVAPKRLKMELENLSVPSSFLCNVKSFRLSPHDPLVYFWKTGNITNSGLMFMATLMTTSGLRYCQKAVLNGC